MSDIQLYGALPGTGTLLSSQEGQIWVGRDSSQEFGSIVLDSGCVDSRNSPNTLISPGLVLGLLTTGYYTNYSPTASNGAEIAVAITNWGTNMLDNSGSAAVKSVQAVLKGIVQPDFLQGLDSLARRQMVTSGKFIFSDSIQAQNAFLGGPMSQVVITANTTLNTTHYGKLVICNSSGAITVTLPALNTTYNGAIIEILNMADQTVTISTNASDTTKVIADGNAACSNVLTNTNSHKIGSRVQFLSSPSAGNWTVRNLGGTTLGIS